MPTTTSTATTRNTACGCYPAPGLLEVVELGLGRSCIRSDEGLVFPVILGLGVIFEAGRRAKYGSGAMIRE